MRLVAALLSFFLFVNARAESSACREVFSYRATGAAGWRKVPRQEIIRFAHNWFHERGLPLPDYVAVVDSATGGMTHVVATAPGGTAFSRGYQRKQKDLERYLYLRGEARVENLQGLKVLDAGCGNSPVVEHWHDHGIDALALDLILNEQQRQSPLYVQGDMRRMPFPDASFDRVFSTWGPHAYGGFGEEHVAHSRLLLAESSRVLKAGGLMHLAPAREHLISEAIAGVPELIINQEPYANCQFDETVELRKLPISTAR